MANYALPTTGTYYVVLTGTSAIDYNLVVTRNAELDSEANDSLGTAQQVLSLPIYPELTDGQVAQVCEALRRT